MKKTEVRFDMKKTEVRFDLVDATPDQISDIIKLITGLGDSVTTFTVRSIDSNTPTRSPGKSGRYLYAPREASEPTDPTDPTDPALDTHTKPERLDIRPDVKDVEDPAAPVKKEGDVSPSNLKKYL